MACDTPYLVFKKGDHIKNSGHLVYEHDVLVPCGKCPPCKNRRINDWVLRLEEEDKGSSSSFFITLTYDSIHIPITNNGYMNLDHRDIQLFLKKLRRRNQRKIRYYMSGEYGTIRQRPHYHLIIFNIEDTENIFKSWKLGGIHIGNVSGASIAYTAKYIDKKSIIPQDSTDDRKKEYSAMSNGLGYSFLTPEMIQYYKNDLKRYSVNKNGSHIRALPRYYRKQIYTELEIIKQTKYIQASVQRKSDVDKQKFLKLYPNKELDYETYKDNARYNRYQKHYGQTKREDL